ncbi:restriction endonuclease subunit S [Geobacillus zalihae]|uniref:restriction endonuclease subunit S n=1 Tax=Geobacillus zalihae TaxID=213419 RepID=UPI00260ADC6B|nr:restriction endonuclease subunit S [Geobacillus zalihae]WKA47782.1 restriction endonuclease subunit S [Geobacillus zalihae]
MIRTKYKVLKLEDIAVNSKNAIVDGPFGSALKVKDYVDDGIPVLQGKNISNFQFNFSDIRYITPQKAQELIRSKVEVGDILFVKIGSIGYSAEVTDLNGYPFAIIPANLAKVSIDYSKVDKNYLLFWLRSDTVVNYLKKNASKTAQPALSLGKIKQIPVVMPSLETQKKISAVLLKAQELIDKRKAQIEALDQLTQSVFLEMFGDPKLNKKNWKKQKLNDVCLRKGEYGSGSSAIPYDSGKPRYIRITDIRDDGSLNDDIVAPSNPDDYEKYRLNEGDILFARSGATVGKTYLHSEKNGYCIFAGYLIRFVPDTSKINPKFLFHFTRTQYYKQWVMSKQNTVAQPNINAKQYGEELFIICPPLELQNRFAKIVEEIEAEKELLQKSMVELQNNFNSLMQRAFKGELFND